MKTKLNNWLLQLEDWAVSEEGQEGDKALETYDAATDPDLNTRAMTIANLFAENKAIILGVGEEGGDDDTLDEMKFVIRLFHSPINLGGKRTRKEDKLLVLEGLTDKADVLELDGQALVKVIETYAPKEEDLFDCESEEDVRNLEVGSRTKAREFKVCGAFIIPPWAMRAVLKAKTNVPAGLIMALIEEAKVTERRLRRQRAKVCGQTPPFPMVRSKRRVRKDQNHFNRRTRRRNEGLPPEETVRKHSPTIRRYEGRSGKSPRCGGNTSKPRGTRVGRHTPIHPNPNHLSEHKDE